MSDAYHDVLGVRLPAHVAPGVPEAPGGRDCSAIAALAGVGCLGVALLTWSVEDPSLNHATSARVHNLLGAPGAIAADIVMQMLGLACVAALAPPAFWGWRLLTERRLANARRKAAFYLVGDRRRGGARFAACPRPEAGRCRPGLGGVIGDALLALPRRLAARSTWGVAATGAIFAAVAILAPHRGLRRRRTAARPTRRRRRPSRRAAPQRARTTRTPRTSRGSAIVSIGAVIHALLTMRAALRRLVRRPAKAAGQEPPRRGRGPRGLDRASRPTTAG